MKYCPICYEGFEEDLLFCTFDGEALQLLETGQRITGRQPIFEEWRNEQKKKVSTAQSHRRKAKPLSRTIVIGSSSVVALCVVAAAVTYLFLSRNMSVETPITNAATATSASKPEEALAPSEAKSLPSLSELSSERLQAMLPPALMRRFAHNRSEDMRILKTDKGEVAVLIGSGGYDSVSGATLRRLLIVKYESEQFADVTPHLLPAGFSAGAVAGARAQVRFDNETPNLFIRVQVPNGGVLRECSSCDHAYQTVTLEWTGARYAETHRTWDDDAFTAFFVFAQALSKRQADVKSKPFMSDAVAVEVSQGFARNSKQGWTVHGRGEGQDSNTVSYELSNGEENLAVTLSKASGRWQVLKFARL